MSSLNKVILIGRLGADPDTRFTQSGKVVTKFRMATDAGWGEKKSTDWHTVVTFDKVAEKCAKYLRKGRMVYVLGRITYRKWEREEGGAQWYTDIIASDVHFIAGQEERVQVPQSTVAEPSGELDLELEAGFATSEIPF